MYLGKQVEELECLPSMQKWQEARQQDFTLNKKIIRTGKLDDLSEEELEKRMAEIIDQYAPILEGVEEKDLKAKG